jgi:hypothetical protein
MEVKGNRIAKGPPSCSPVNYHDAGELEMIGKYNNCCKDGINSISLAPYFEARSQSLYAFSGVPN